MVVQESEATLRNMQTNDDEGRVIGTGDELGELDDEGDEEDEIVLEANNPRQSNRPQGESVRCNSSQFSLLGYFLL